MPVQSTSARHAHVGAPRSIDSAGEALALLELALLPVVWPLLIETPRGDGHPVLLLPGFLGDEKSLVALKLFPASKGYQVESWGLGRNVGFQRKYILALNQKIRHMHFKSGSKVSLVGWSLGGVFALVGALHAPEGVRSIITLGSPLSQDPAGSKTSQMVKSLYRLVAHPMGPSAHAMQPRAQALRRGELPQIPISCLYSLGDGVVPPQEATIDGNPELHENIRVLGGHIALGFNSMVLATVADRLAQAEDRWQPFNPSGLLKTACWMASYGEILRNPPHAAVE